jgi:endoglucanase
MFGKFSGTCIGALLLAFALTGSANADTPTKPAKPAESEAMTFSRKLGIGINLGNTMDATGSKLNSVREYETSWGAPVTTKAIIDGYKASGFKTLRLPVAWSNLMGPDYTINKDLMARVKEITQYALDDDMYVIINIHWDGGWLNNFPTDYDNCMKKYKAVWGQISEQFKNYSDHVIFESLNEETDYKTLWNEYTNNPGNKDKAYEVLNSVNQAFTDVVRTSGGKNRRRYLLIAGYTTNIQKTSDPLFKMPRDPAAHSMVSVHYYSPPMFAILERDADWGKAAYTWGTPEEINNVRTEMLIAKARFIDQGIPVIVGEFSCPNSKDPASIVKYLSTVCETAYSLGMVPVLWDTGAHYDRTTLKWRNPQVGEAFARIAREASTPRLAATSPVR